MNEISSDLRHSPPLYTSTQMALMLRFKQPPYHPRRTATAIDLSSTYEVRMTPSQYAIPPVQRVKSRKANGSRALIPEIMCKPTVSCQRERCHWLGCPRYNGSRRFAEKPAGVSCSMSISIYFEDMCVVISSDVGRCDLLADGCSYSFSCSS